MEDSEILDFSIAASGEHPVVNPALVIKGKKLNLSVF